MRVWAGVVASACACALPAAGSGSTGPPVVRIAAVGDIALAPATDVTALFAGARGDLDGDVVLGNLEGTLASGGTSRCTPTSTDCFAFRAPPWYARALRSAGFTLLNLANNHALDFGAAGQAETVSALDRAGLRHTGRPDEIAYVRAAGLTVALLGFAPYPWAQSLTAIADAQQLVRHAVEASATGRSTSAGRAASSAVLQVSLHADGSWAMGCLRSLLLVPPGKRAIDVENQPASLVRSLSQADFGRRAIRVSRSGVLTPPT